MTTTTKQINPETLALLERSVTVDGDVIRITQQLDRKEYLSVNTVLDSIGGVWNKKLKAHAFHTDTDVDYVFDQVLLTGEMPRTLKNDNQYDYFRTPNAIADQVVSLAAIQNHHTLLDPSAGDCSLLRAYMRTFPLGADRGARVTAVDIDTRFAETIMSFADNYWFRDFLEIDTATRYDRIIMNPPFSKLQDAKHVLHAYSLLATDGILVAIMSRAVTFRTNTVYADVRKLLAISGNMIPLRAGSFKESGTMVNTVIVVLNK